jgi:conjugal transfer ATP-binding protein TraC
MIPLVGGDQAIIKILEGIFQEFAEEGSSLQFLLWADHRIDPFLNKWEKSSKRQGIFAEIGKKRSQFYKQNATLTLRNFRLIISYSRPKSSDVNSDIQQLSKIKSKLFQCFKTLSPAWVWRPKDLLETVEGLLNFSPNPILNKRTYNPFQLLSSQILSGGGLQDLDHHLLLGKEKNAHKSFRVVDTPSHWSSFLMENLIGDIFKDAYRINFPFYIHYGVHYPVQAKQESSFRKKSLLIENQGKSGYLIRLIPELVGELKESDFIRRALKYGAKFVWTQLSAGVWSSEASLETAEQALKNLFRVNEFNLVENTYIQLTHLLSVLPMNWAEYTDDLRHFDVVKTTLSTECSNFIPIQGEWQGTSTPGMILVGRRGQLLNWNPFDNKGNYNCVVFGRSGGGKSVFMQELLMSGLRQGARVFVLDVGRSFQKMCELTKGQFVEFSPETSICLNPFSKLKINTQEEKETAFNFLKSIISCMAAPVRGTDELETPLIEEAINYVWETKGSQATITDIAHWLEKHENEKANNLAIMLTSYTSKGVYAKYFEGENNCNFSNHFVVIELEELKNRKDLQAVVLQLFIMTIANDVFLGDRKTPVYLCIDEAWELLKSPQTASFIETLARRLRKYNGSLITGTQNVDDFFSIPGAKAAYLNSDWSCFLPQKQSAIKELVKNSRISMSESMIKGLESLTKMDGEYSEIMISDADGNYSIARLMLDPFSQLLYSTSPQDYIRLKNLTDRGLAIEEAINTLLESKHA